MIIVQSTCKTKTHATISLPEYKLLSKCIEMNSAHYDVLHFIPCTYPVVMLTRWGCLMDLATVFHHLTYFSNSLRASKNLNPI